MAADLVVHLQIQIDEQMIDTISYIMAFGLIRPSSSRRNCISSRALQSRTWKADRNLEGVTGLSTDFHQFQSV